MDEDDGFQIIDESAAVVAFVALLVFAFLVLHLDQ